MGSFYGGAGISAQDAENKINQKAQEVTNHVIVSTTEPIVQKQGDIWLVIVSDDND